MPNVTDSTNRTNTTNTADTFAFQYEGTDITLSRAELDALSGPLQLAAHDKYMVSLGRILGPGRGNFFKRWKGLFNEGGAMNFDRFSTRTMGIPRILEPILARRCGFWKHLAIFKWARKKVLSWERFRCC